jgi:hypothetical protein
MIGLKLASEEYQFLVEDYEKEQRRRDAEEHGLSVMEEDENYNESEQPVNIGA